ncbi:MAG: OmpA family protein [Rhodobacterales bacterium]|nr:OmpA family protein [Rhodobacterales bacterium]
MRRLILGTFLAVETGLLLVLAGCGAAFDYDALRDLNPQGDGFDAALAREYRTFALFEADDMRDWPDAAHFGAKALAAARGADVAPERPADWRLPVPEGAVIRAEAARLDGLMERGARTRLPAQAAKAQAGLDCWIEQQEENWQTADIAACRDTFHGAVTALEAALVVPAAATGDPLTRTRVAPDDPMAPDGAGAMSYTLFFAFDSATLTPEDGATLDAIADTARADMAAGGGGSVRLLVGGHADRAGPRSYNGTLSMRRAVAVQRALVDRGVDDARITVVGHGESSPRVLTPDGLRDARNRRVEVTVGPAPAL